MDALGRVVGNWCLDISNLAWVVWNLPKRFAKDLMLQRGSIAGEVQRVTVGLKEVSSKISQRQADGDTGSIAETWHVRLLWLWSAHKHAVHQCQNILATGRLIQHFEAFFSSSLNHLHRFKVSTYRSIHSVTLHWHKPQTTVCVLAEVVVAMSAKLVTFGSSSATFPFPG